MFAGHLGAALVLGRAERRVNVGMFMAAALMLDMLLWAFILLGWEQVAIPRDFAATHQPQFDFIYSHSLAATLVWSAVAACCVALWRRRQPGAAGRVPLLIAVAVASHWFIDVLVHRPEMPLAGIDSARMGLALWDTMPLALAIESAIVAVGLALFLPGSGLSRRRSIALVILVLTCLVFTVAGMTVAPAPPSPFAMAASSLLTLLVVCAAATWLCAPGPRHSR